MAFCSMFYFFVISYFTISDIQCSERITTANISTETNSDMKKNIDLLQLINQETLIRFELDRNIRNINSKVDTITIDNKLASDRFNQEILSLNTTLSLLRKNQDETNEAVNIVKSNQTSTGSLLKEKIKSLKQKQEIDNKIASDRFNQEMRSINTTLSELKKNQDETYKTVNIVKTNQTSTDSLLKKEIKSLKQKQEIDNKIESDRFNQEIRFINTTLSELKKNQDETYKTVNIVKTNQTSTDSLLKEEIKYLKLKQEIDNKKARDQFNQEILSINTTLSGLRKNQVETYEAVNKVKTNQTSTESEIALLKNEIKSMKHKHVQLEYNQQKLITDLVKDKIENTLLKQEMESLKASQRELKLNVTGSLEARKSQISFNAGLSSGKADIYKGQRIIYGHVISNIGNDYNAHTGIFTSPQEGTYVFFFSTYPYDTDEYLYLDIVRNGYTVVRGRAYDKNYYDAVSSLAVIHLDAGDRVWIKCHDGCKAGIRNLGGSYTSTFSGFML